MPYNNNPPPNTPPVVSIVGGNRTVADTDSLVGELVAFTATATDSDGTIASTEWLINGQVVATGTSATLALPDGVTEVTFRAIDNGGFTSSTTVLITVIAPESESVIVYTVTVASGTNQYGSGNKYYIQELSGPSPTLNLLSGQTYKFDQSHSSNATHPLYFSTTADGIWTAGGVQYTTGVVRVGTPGEPGAHVQISINTPSLYYYCGNHAGMGGLAYTPVEPPIVNHQVNAFVSSALLGNLDRNFQNARHSIAVYTQSYTGRVVIQASCLLNVPSSNHTSNDWFDVASAELENHTSIVHRTFVVNANWIRVVSYPANSTSSITQVLLRN